MLAANKVAVDEAARVTGLRWRRSEPTRYSHQRSWPASPISFRNFGQGWSCAASARPRERILQYLRLRADLDRRSIAIEGQLQYIAAEIGINPRSAVSDPRPARSRRVHRARGISDSTQET